MGGRLPSLALILTFLYRKEGATVRTDTVCPPQRILIDASEIPASLQTITHTVEAIRDAIPNTVDTKLAREVLVLAALLSDPHVRYIQKNFYKILAIDLSLVKALFVPLNADLLALVLRDSICRFLPRRRVGSGDPIPSHVSVVLFPPEARDVLPTFQTQIH